MTCVLRTAGLQPEAAQTCFFYARIEVRMGADGAAELADADALAGLSQPLVRAAEFVVHQREFQPESHRLGVDAVAAADHGRVLEGPRPVGDHAAQRRQVREQEVAGGGHLHGQRRIEDVRGGQTLMNPSSCRSDVGGDVFEESDDVVLRALFDLVDFIDGEPRLGADGPASSIGIDPSLGEGLAGEHFNFEPDREFALLRPEGAHFGTGIPGNHRIDTKNVRPGKSKRQLTADKAMQLACGMKVS